MLHCSKAEATNPATPRRVQVNNIQSKIALATETPNAAAANATAFTDAGNAQIRATLEQGLQHARKAAEGAHKATEEFSAFTRGSVEVFAQVMQTWMAGTHDLNRRSLAFVQSATDSALEGARALSGAKSLNEAVAIQATFARTAIDRMMSGSAELQQASLRLVEQTSGPVTRHVTQAVERATKSLAA